MLKSLTLTLIAITLISSIGILANQIANNDPTKELVIPIIGIVVSIVLWFIVAPKKEIK